MKKIAMLLIAALLLCALATAETAQTSAYALTLPEGFVPVTEAELEGYREASARDAGGVYQGEALMARRGNAAISVVETATAYAGTREAAEALVAEYADYVAGFDGVEPQYIEAGGREFAMIQVSLDGEVTSQYLLVQDGRLYTLTFTGVPEAETLAALESLTFASEAAPSPSAAPIAAQETPSPSAAPQASAAAQSGL